MSETLHPATGDPAHLTEAQRHELLVIIRDNPGATIVEVRDRFEARTGRRVSAESVRRAWVVGYRPATPGERRRALTEAERTVLLGLCLLAAPDYPRTVIARKFELATGRGITPANVRKFLRDRLGVADARRPGRPRLATEGGRA